MHVHIINLPGHETPIVPFAIVPSTCSKAGVRSILHLEISAPEAPLGINRLGISVNLQTQKYQCTKNG
jgi:hypothetical protein